MKWCHGNKYGLLQNQIPAPAGQSKFMVRCLQGENIEKDHSSFQVVVADLKLLSCLLLAAQCYRYKGAGPQELFQSPL